MVDYIGSKTKLLDWLFESFLEETSSLEDKTFLDGCAGTGAVSFRAKELGAKVHSNDLLSFSEVYISGYANLPQEKKDSASIFLQSLNNLPQIDGFFFKNYSESAGRKYFTDYNAGKIDAIVDKIRTYPDTDIRNYALACLLEAVSRVSNTAGTHGAFLKKFKERSLSPLELRSEPICTGKNIVTTYNSDLLNLITTLDLEFDIFYLDPPYTSRQYGPNYHLYETLIKNDNPKIHGVTGLRDWQEESDSSFCRDKEARKFFYDILSQVKAKSAFISYSSDGLLKKEEIFSIIEASRPGSRLRVKELPYKRYKADSSRAYKQDVLLEYLFISVMD